MTTARFRLLANPEAGSVDRETIERTREALRSLAPADLVWTTDESELDRALSDLEDRTPVFVGGDGSLNVGLTALRRLGLLDRTVGYLPAGTGNDLGRDIGLPVDPVEAAPALVRARRVRMPLLEVTNGHGLDTIAANNVHLGLGPVVAEEASDLKPVLGRMAYPVTAGRIGFTGEGIDVRVDVDGDPLYEGSALAVGFFLGRYMGGGVEVSQTSHADGRMEVVVVEEGSKLERLGLAFALVRGDDDRPGVHRLHARSASVESQDPMKAVVDGDIHDVGASLAVREVSDGWWILLPDDLP